MRTSLSIPHMGPSSPTWAGAGTEGLHLGRRTHSDQWFSTVSVHVISIFKKIFRIQTLRIQIKLVWDGVRMMFVKISPDNTNVQPALITPWIGSLLDGGRAPQRAVESTLLGAISTIVHPNFQEEGSLLIVRSAWVVRANSDYLRVFVQSLSKSQTGAYINFKYLSKPGNEGKSKIKSYLHN